MNGNERRAAARRAAWASAAKAMRMAELAAPPVEVAAEERATALYWETRREVQAYLDDRAKGLLCAPPGGVGGPRRRASR